MTLTRPLSIASAASVTIHIVVGLALGLVFANVHLSELDTLPVLSLHLAVAEQGSSEQTAERVQPQAEPLGGDAPPSAPTGHVARHDSEHAAKPVPPAPVVEREVEPASDVAPAGPPAEHSAAAAMSEVEQGTPWPAATAEFEPELADAPALAQGSAQDSPGDTHDALIATPAPATTWVATARAGMAEPEALREPLDARERKMMDKRLERWAQRIDRLAAEPAIEWKHRGAVYQAQFRPRPARDNTGFDEVLVTVSTEQDGRRLSTEMVLRRLAFSHFGQFVHRWDPRVQIHDDVIDGRFHANSDVQLSYSRKVVPTFNGRVTIAGRRVQINSAQGFVSRSEMFRGGLQTGVRMISLPERFAPFAAADVDDDALVHEFDEDTRIVFTDDGHYSFAPLNTLDGRRRRALSAPAQYLLGTGRARLHVAGTINGRVLVYSPERIVIEGSLRYANDPARDAQSDDYLGLVSDRSIEIAAARITGPGDLRIDAAVYAKRSFRVRDFRSGETDLLHLYGSLTAGSLDATEPRYRTRIEFDERFERVRPPAFPVTGRYELVAWDGDWVVAQ